MIYCKECCKLVDTDKVEFDYELEECKEHHVCNASSHPCPYLMVIEGDPIECDCCEKCEQNCSDRI